MKEILKNLVETTTLPEDTYLEQDSEILDIYVEEIEEIFTELDQLLNQWIDNPADSEALTSIRRHFHTLKGSGRMVGARSAGELAWAVEDSLNRVMAGTVELTPTIQQYVKTVYQVFKYKLYDNFKTVQPHSIDLRPLVLLGQQLQKNESLEPALQELLVLAERLTAADVKTGLELLDEDDSTAVQDEPGAEAAAEQQPFDIEETVSIFLEESEEHLAVIDRFLNQEQPDAHDYNHLIRALHTLRGSSSMAQIENVFEASTKIENLFKTLLQDELLSTSQETALLTNYTEFVRDYLHILRQGQPERLEEIYALFNAAWDSYDFQVEERSEAIDPQGLVSQLIELNIDQLLDAEFEFEKRVRTEFPRYIQQLSAQAQQLVAHSNNRAAAGIHQFAQQLHDSYQQLLAKPALLNIDYAYELYEQAHQDLIYLFDTLAAGQRILLTDDLQKTLSELHAFVHQELEQFAEAESETIEPVQQEIPPAVEVEEESAPVTHFDIAAIAQHLAHDQQLLDAANANHDFDPDLLDIFIEEAEELLVGIDQDLNSWSQDQDNISALNNLMRYLHTLKGGANMIQATHLGLISHELETIYERVIHKQIQVSHALVQVIRLIQDNLADRIQTIREEKVDYPAPHSIEILQNIEALVAGAFALATTETAQKVSVASAVVQAEPVFAEHAVFETALLGSEAPEVEFCGDFSLVEESEFETEMLEADPLEFIESPTAEIKDTVTLLAEETAPEIEMLETKALTTDESEPDESLIVEIEETDTAFAEEVKPEVEALETEALMADEPESTERQAVEITESFSSFTEDPQVRSIVEEAFLEEAQELVESAYSLLQQWIDQRSDRSVLLQLQRAAHSLKGGARMVELEPIAVIAYQLETAFEKFALHNFNSNAYDALLQTALDWLKQAVLSRDYSNFDSLKFNLSAIEFVDVTVQLPSKVTQTDLLNTPVMFEFVQGDGTEPPSMMGEWDSTQQLDNNNEMIRISADLVEKMIDLSGENAINRSRIEMDLSQLGNTLNEMELAIQRLADQLRRMEGELESQIIAKHGDEASRYKDFDPLEMDQYSSLNQLSKSLAESASDLVDFKITLAEKIRDTEGLLLQQSRIQAEIQESLMRTRLVPFSRLLPRLQRIVRQTSSTLNRPAELLVRNTEGELDRTILERLVTPFEHMLRNAIDHGIEDPAQRAELNKPATGLIELNITRQGTDVVVTFSDDGKGIDVEKIKQKAIQLNLMQADQQLEPQEILQFIFHPGFTTAQAVTQISGRGVGLDVVQSDIKALGGHLSVESVLGKGTTFTIRVPTTVAVSDALMVKVGDQQFALPLAQIERIVRISPAALEDYFHSKEDFFQIDQGNYKLRYLSEFISNQPAPRLSGVMHSLPVLLIKSPNGQTVALLVDQLVGSRAQIVVKSIGQQFDSVGSIAGATILGDGQVCLILDGQNIARQVQNTQRIKQSQEMRELQRLHDERRLIMIVDDSVTVRKVTTRLLERQGYDVVTAKDGIDAIEQLENVKPDLMLLDIEMPRMDGFEVTNLVRHHDVHQHLPIIMITSRTGEKHRERAFSLGVSHYMGKPFQEEELLENIETLLAVAQG